jgi:hypothetical protein
MKGRQKRIEIEMTEDVQAYRVGGFFDYSPSMSYADVTYNLIYGFINATLGFQTVNEEICIDIIGGFYTNITRDIPA